MWKACSFRARFHLICHGYFFIFAHVPVFSHSFSMLIPTRRSIYQSMFLFSSIHFQCLYRPDAQSINLSIYTYQTLNLYIYTHIWLRVYQSPWTRKSNKGMCTAITSMRVCVYMYIHMHMYLDAFVGRSRWITPVVRSWCNENNGCDPSAQVAHPAEPRRCRGERPQAERSC